jgi:hypothetical protein
VTGGNERGVLKGAGRISYERMEQIAHERFATYDASRRAAETAEAESEAMDDIEQLERDAKQLQEPGEPQ